MLSASGLNNSDYPGIYLHIPLCQSKCGYCDFYSETDLSLKGQLINALCGELSFYRDRISKSIFDSIYIGGGTPSLLELNELDLIFNTIHQNYSLSDHCEITLEANPGTVSPAKLKMYRSLGINRLSIGLQSFQSSELVFLQRIHTADENREIMTQVKETGFDNISVDLIYALPDQTEELWENTLEQTVQFMPEHISAYNLIIEEGTPFHSLYLRGLIKPQSAEREARFYNITNSILRKCGYEQYEISNFNRDNRYSQHNMKYWNHIPYLGFGPSAHSYWDQRRYSNVPSVSKYISQISEGLLPVSFTEEIDLEKLMFEYIFLRLRVLKGINLQKFKFRFKQNFHDRFAKIISTLVENELATDASDYFRLTQKGLLLSDEISPLFLEH